MLPTIVHVDLTFRSAAYVYVDTHPRRSVVLWDRRTGKVS